MGRRFSEITGIRQPKDLLAPGTRTKDTLKGISQGITGGSSMDTGGGGRLAPPDPMQQMIDTAPDYLEDMYGGTYDPNKFGYDRQDFDIDSITGYDPTKLGGEGFEIGGYDVAQRGGLQGYDPTQIDAMNFDPYRRNKLQDVSATSASGQASAEGALARTGGMSAADRMALASQFNRDKIAGRSQSLGQTDELEAANRFQTQMENARAQTGADRYLAGQENLGMFTDQRLMTDANRYGSDAQNRAAEINAAAQTTADQRRGEAQDQLRMQNTSDANAYARANAERRYREQGDLYGGKRDEWMTRGQIMSGNPNLDYGPPRDQIDYSKPQQPATSLYR